MPEKPIYLYWHQLTKAQRSQAYDLSLEITSAPSAYQYEVDQDGNVIDYQPLDESE